MSLILLPGAYYVQKDLEARSARQQHQQLTLEKVQTKNRILENAVQERTRALHFALVSVERSQKALEHQLYIQSRLLASFNHDIKEPIKFSVIVSQKIAQLALVNVGQTPIQQYAKELSSSLENTFMLIKNHLEFTKLPIQQKIERDETVDLGALLEEKAQLFAGSIQTNKNSLSIDVDHQTTIYSNYNLLGIILHNLIDNANKYTLEGSIKISAATVDSYCQITITNEGISVAKHVTDWVNSQVDWTGADAHVHPDGVHGIGLLLVKEIAAILNISLRMRSDATQTRVTLTFGPSTGLNQQNVAPDSSTAS